MLDTQNTEIGYLCGRIFASAVNIERASKSGEQTRRTMAQKMGEAMRHPADFFPMMHFETLRQIVDVQLKDGVSIPTKYEDYVITVEGTLVPAEVKMHEVL